MSDFLVVDTTGLTYLRTSGNWVDCDDRICARFAEIDEEGEKIRDVVLYADDPDFN